MATKRRPTHKHSHVKNTHATGPGIDTRKPPPTPQQSANSAWNALRNAPHVPHGQIRLTSIDPPMVWQAELADKAPLLSNGFGGWQTVDRPRRIQLTNWTGSSTFQLVVEVVMDCWSEPTGTVDVEDEIAVLEALAQKPDHLPEPPIVQIDGGGSIPRDVHWSPQSFWVLNDIQYSDQLWNQNGRRSRAVATLTLLEYQPDTLAVQTTPNKSRGAKRKIYIVKAGDTLQSIAAHQLHKRSRWREIAKLNHIRDPKAIHKGQHLKMP